METEIMEIYYMYAYMVPKPSQQFYSHRASAAY